MIFLIFCGPFHSVLNLTLSPRFLISLRMSTLNLGAASNLSNVITAANLTIPLPAPCLLLTVSLSACHVPTPRSKMAKLSALSAPPIISFAHFSFRRPCRPPTGLTPSPLLPMSLTDSPPKLSTCLLPSLLSMVNYPLTMTSECLGAHAIPTSLPLHLTNLLPAPPYVPSSGTPPIIKATGVLIFLLIVSSSLVMSSLMRRPFPFLDTGPQPPTNLIF